MQQIWKAEDVDVWVYYYRVLITSADSGLIETITDSISVHSLKKDAYARKLNTAGKIYDLADYYKRVGSVTWWRDACSCEVTAHAHSLILKEYGPIGSERYAAAQKCFLRSLAGYCLVTFILAIKDRHNGNILIDKSGHISMSGWWLMNVISCDRSWCICSLTLTIL